MKTITVPKSIFAEGLLDQDKCPLDQLEEYHLSQTQFNKLWSIGLFEEMNQICGTLIDDYESESISKMESIIKVIAFIESRKWSEDVNGSIAEIENLFNKAREYNTSVHFYF